MKRFIGAIALAAAASGALAIPAMWTGRSEFVTTVTGRQALRCEYTVYGSNAWYLFVGANSCPMTIEVQ